MYVEVGNSGGVWFPTNTQTFTPILISPAILSLGCLLSFFSTDF